MNLKGAFFPLFLLSFSRCHCVSPPPGPLKKGRFPPPFLFSPPPGLEFGGVFLFAFFPIVGGSVKSSLAGNGPAPSLFPFPSPPWVGMLHQTTFFLMATPASRSVGDLLSSLSLPFLIREQRIWAFLSPFSHGLGRAVRTLGGLVFLNSGVRPQTPFFFLGR